MNIDTVREIAGHADEKTTLKHYCYDRSSNEEKYNNILQALN